MTSHTQSPYCLERNEKDKTLTRALLELSGHHRKLCPAYDRMLKALGTDLESVSDYRELPFLPVGLFKRLTLSSLEGGDNTKTMTSSGTTGQRRSEIILDGETRTAQQKALAEIGMSFLGPDRMPMLVIDCPSTVKNRDNYSARTAGILGFSLFGAHRTFALKDDMSLDMEAVQDFLGKYGKEKFLVFGFTFMIWQYLCMALEKSGCKLDMEHAILVHGGGWKKLEALNISRDQLKEALNKTCKVTRVHDYYGMAEQAGSIFMECEFGHLHASDYSGVIIRRPKDYSICDIGEPGLIQVLSVLPKSYPGHSLLTEDEGVLLGEDDCPCGRLGAYFRVNGRIRHAEIRGCSDTYEAL